MLTVKNYIKKWKAHLGWDTQDADYTLWRNAVKDYCAHYKIKIWSGTSDTQRAGLVKATRSLTSFRPSIRACLAWGSNFHVKALAALLQDCMKRGSEAAKNLAVKRALKRPRLDKDEEDKEGEEPTVGVQNRAVVFLVNDPNDLYLEDNKNR